MNLKSFVTVKALVSLIFAVVQLLVPATLISMIGAGAATPTLVFMARPSCGEAGRIPDRRYGLWEDRR